MGSISSELTGWLGQWNVIEHTYSIPVSGTPVLILPGNPLRWAAIVSGAWQLEGTSGVISMSTVPASLAAGLGVQLNTTQLNWRMTYRDFGLLVQLPYYAGLKGAGAPISVNVTEILIQQ